ncbi:MAG: FkbM family methyltransferase [Stellaceae bacterium]
MSKGGGGYYRLRLNPGFVAHLFKAMAQQHHRALAPLLKPFIPDDAVVIDVGAHAGQFTKLFARLAPKGRVYAVEPQSYARAILRIALRINRLRNAAVVALALDARPGVALLHLPVKRSGSYGFGLAHLKAAGETGTGVEEAVGVATLDALVAALGLERLDFIKADIEGHELGLIEGARQTFARFHPALLLEHDRSRLARAGANLDVLWQTLIGLGYHPYAANAPRTPLAAPADGDVLWLP